MTCAFIWNAPKLLPPDGQKEVWVKQKCSLQEGHGGVHRSLTNVICLDRGQWTTTTAAPVTR